MDKNTRILILVLGTVFVMTSLAFASVPLYNVFCRVTGFGGTTQVSNNIPNQVFNREITVRFNADISKQLPWTFKPDTSKMTVHVGAQNLINFTATNKSNETVTGTALYNVTPLKIGKYFQKTQCFCFDEQTLSPGQKTNMPVAFYIDPAIMDDESMSDVTSITLSYSFFRAETKELDTAIEAFYNAK